MALSRLLTPSHLDFSSHLFWLLFAAFLVFAGLGVLVLVSLATVGFLRTIYIEKNKRCSPLSLIRTGLPFFLRFAGFYILYMLVMLLLLWPVGWITKTTITTVDSNGNMPLARYIGLSCMTLILAKPWLLIPAIIIVLDCRLSESFALLWKIKLLKAKPLLILFLVQAVVLSYLLRFFPGIYKVAPQLSWLYLFRVLYYGISAVLSLIVDMLAVRFVSSQPVIEHCITCNRLQTPES